MENQKLIKKMLKEIDEASKIRLKNFQRQIAKDFKKIRKRYERLLKFGEDKKLKNKLEEKIKEKLEDVLDEQFPKGECKERGHALVLFAEMWIQIEKLEKKRKYWENKFKELEWNTPTS